MMYRRILIATDGSEYTKRAVAHAVEIARLSKADLHIVYVIEKGKGCGPDSCTTVDLSPKTMDGALLCKGNSAVGYVEGLAKANGVRTEKWILQGEPADEIAKLADRLPADLVVMGRYGTSGLGRLVLGSTAEKVMRSTRAPVLTVLK